MLGHTGVGKTTYMASMYGTLQTPINGFSLHMQGSSEHRGLLKDFANIQRGTYPPPTARRNAYDFMLQFRGNAIFPFQWVDYRGGALEEKQSQSSQADELVNELQEADGIMLFCDADPAPRVRRKVRSQVARMVTLVTQALQNSDNPTTIAVVFAKSDLIEELDDELTDNVSNLLTAIHASKAHVGTLLPIACGPKMVNPEAPVLFALHFGILFQEIRLTLEVEQWKKVEQHFIDRGNTFWGTVGNVINGMIGEATTYDHAHTARTQAEAKKREIDKLSGPAQLLSQYLDELPIVFGEALRDLFSDSK